MAQKWYNLSPDQVAGRMRTELDKGLSVKEARRRLQKEGKNTVYRSAYRASAKQLLKQVVCDPCALLLLLCAVLAGFFGQDIAQNAIIGLILINWICVFFAYVTARMIMADSTESTIPTATVLRDGKLYKIKQNKVCHGDIILLEKGDVVPADARIIKSNNLTLLEASLTGDLTIKHKNEATIPSHNLTPNMQTNMVFATTIVASGTAVAVVCETGEDTLAVILRRNIELTENNSLSAIGSLRRYCSLRSIIILCAVFAITVINLIFSFSSGGIFGVFISGLCLAAAAMCEYSTIFGYIIIGCGLFNALKKNKSENAGALVKNSATVENLSAITTLIVPKNGAFTSNSLHINSLYCNCKEFSPHEKSLGDLCGNLICTALDSTSFGEQDYIKVYNFNKARSVTAEDRAIFDLADKQGVFTDRYGSEHIVLEHIETTEMSPKCFSLVRTPQVNRLVIRGDLSYVLPLCTQHRTQEGTKPIEPVIPQITEEYEKAINDGCTVLCFATKPTDKPTIDGAKNGGNMIFEGFITINESAVSGAFANVAKLREAGIKVIMLSDDTSLATRTYAKSIGVISDENTEVSTARSVRVAKNQLLRADSTPYSLYEGLNASQVSLLIDALHDNGEIVGYFGDDFNDIALLKQADVGYSPGVTLSGSSSSIDMGNANSPANKAKQYNEALKLICDVIVSPSERRGGGFNAIVRSISQSRAVFVNILNCIKYLTATQYARLCLVFASILFSKLFFGGMSIIAPVQILFTGVICDLAMIIITAFDTPNKKIAAKSDFDTDFSHPLAKNKREVVIGAIWAALTVAVIGILKLCKVEMTESQMCTTSFLGFIYTQFTVGAHSLTENTIFLKKPKKNTPFVASMIGILAFTLLALLIKPFGALFKIETIGIPMIIGAAIIPIAVFFVYEIFKKYSLLKYETGKHIIKKSKPLPGSANLPPHEKIRNNKSRTLDTDWIEDTLKYGQNDRGSSPMDLSEIEAIGEELEETPEEVEEEKEETSDALTEESEKEDEKTYEDEK